MTIEPGTLMHKAIPPQLVEPYLTGRRTVIAGFVYRAADTSFADPADYYDAMDLSYEDSGFAAGMTELYLLRWSAVAADSYQVPYSAQLGGDWAVEPPFTGTGFSSSKTRMIAEFYTDPVPVPVGAEIYRITALGGEFIARFDGQVWLRPAGAV
jgi:hypothetical protein